MWVCLAWWMRFGFGGAVVVGLVVVADGEERLLVASERERENELINK